jgi:ribosomal protein S18 acetylase RimI-like enzyme
VQAGARIAAFDLVSRADDAVAVQAAALGPAGPDRASIFTRHATYPDFRAFGAFDAATAAGARNVQFDARLVGFGYGTACLPGQWWHDQIRPALVRAGHGRWLDGAFAVTELHVLPEYQGRGIGRDLLTRLLDGLPSLYRHLGFVDLVTGFRFPMQEQPYALMAAPLPLQEDG